MKPAAPSPRRKLSTKGAMLAAEAVLRNPTVGIVGLLRARRERPRGRASEERDEFASSQV